MAETRDQYAWRKATLAARQIIAQSKNPRTRLGRMSPDSVARHAAWAAIWAYRQAHDDALVEEYRRRNRAG